MFLDIRNFTPFVESHKPEEVVNYLNNLFHFMIESVERYDGVINQFWEMGLWQLSVLGFRRQYYTKSSFGFN